jgi:hypothetical protein
MHGISVCIQAEFNGAVASGLNQAMRCPVPKIMEFLAVFREIPLIYFAWAELRRAGDVSPLILRDAHQHFANDFFLAK